MNYMQSENTTNSPTIWAIGGGKGGVGKSLVSILLGISLARKGKKTMLVDADLGGANLHTLMGIKTPDRTLNDFVTRKYRSIEDICARTSIDNLQIICGASEILSLANPQYTQKNKILQSILKLPADHVLLDLGAGDILQRIGFFSDSAQSDCCRDPAADFDTKCLRVRAQCRIPQTQPHDVTAGILAESL